MKHARLTSERVLGRVGNAPLSAVFIVGIPAVGFLGGDLFDKVGTLHAGAGLGGSHGFLDAAHLIADHGTHGSERPEMAGQGPGVNALNAGDFPLFQVAVESLPGAPVAGDLTEFFDDKPAHVRFVALVVERIDPVIPDHWIGHRNDLTTVGRIRQNLLITRHRGVETDLSGHRARSTE